MSVSSASSRSSPDRSPSRKSKGKSALNPLRFLKSKNNYVGPYDYFSDDDSLHSDSFEDLPLGIHGRGGWSYSFDSDDSDDDDLLKSPPSPSSHAQIFFHTTFDDTKEEDDGRAALVPIPCARERHMSALKPTTIRPLSPPPYASNYMSRAKAARQGMSPTTRAYEADSDTSGTVDTDEDYDDPTYTLPKKRTIRFADEAGRDLQTVYITERDKDDADEHLYHMRMIVLLLNPKKKQFEFLHLTTPREERTHILEAVRLFPSLASDGTFGKQKYVGMCRPMKDGQELINSLCLQDYDIDRDEILVAIPKGLKSRDICRISTPLLHDRNVQKMVKRKMRSGFAVQSLPYAMEVANREHHHHEEKGGDENTSNESAEQTTKDTRSKKEDTEVLTLPDENPAGTPIETRQNSDGSENDTPDEDTRSEAVSTGAEMHSHREEVNEKKNTNTDRDIASEPDHGDDASASTSTGSSSVKVTSLGTGEMIAQEEECKTEDSEVKKDDEVSVTISSIGSSVKEEENSEMEDDGLKEDGEASVSASSAGSATKATLMATSTTADTDDENCKIEDADMVQDEASVPASSSSSPARSTSMATGIMVAQDENTKTEDTELNQSDEASAPNSSISSVLKALLTVASNAGARDDEVGESIDAELNQNDGGSVSTTSIGSAAKALLLVSAAATNQDDMGEKTDDMDEMKQIKKYFDELQRQMSTEMESIMTNEDKNEAPIIEGVPSLEEDDEDVGALFAPVEHALNDALAAFHASAMATEDIDETMPDSLNVSMETRAGGVLGTSDAPLSLAEAIAMISSPEEQLFSPETSVTSKDHSFSPCSNNSVEVVDEFIPSGLQTGNDDVTSDTEMVTVTSSNAAVNESVDEDGFPLINEPGLVATSKDIVSPNTEKVTEIPPSSITDDESTQNCDPVPVLEDIVHEVSSVENNVFADSVASSDERDDSDGENGDDFSLRSYSTSDEDEEHVEGHENDGAFPVAKPSVPTCTDVEEVDDISENDTRDREPAKRLSPLIKSKSKVSRANIHSRHIASGSFCSGSPKRDQVNPSDDIEQVPDMADEHVVVEVDELRNIKSEEEEKKRRFILFQLWSATVLVAVGLFLRTFRRRKKKTAEF